MSQPLFYTISVTLVHELHQLMLQYRHYELTKTTSEDWIMQVYTMDRIPQLEIVEAKGAVLNEQVFSVDIVTDTLSGLGSMFGGNSSSYTKEYRKGREIVLNGLEQKAQEMGADSIVGLKIQYGQFINSEIMLLVISANGTAVVTKPIADKN
ncbi:hypothetical protein CPR19088_GLDEOEPO_02243 [Companilactobacillus paralimentarius]